MNQADSTTAQVEELSQVGRVVSVFTAPSRTFEDIRSGRRSWWLPFVLLAVISYALFASVMEHVGLAQTVQNQIRLSPRAQERMAQASPEQIERMQEVWGGFTEGIFLASPLVGLVSAVAVSGVLLATINFCFGGRARFSEMLAVVYYAWLPGAIQVLMGIAVMFFQPPETFNIKNFAPTNPAALFLDPASATPALYTFLTQIDIVTVWMLVLLSIGVAIIAKVKRSSGFVTVFGWWLIVVIFKVGFAAAFN